MCLANLHGGAAEDKGKRVRFHKIGGGSRGGRGRTSASSLASSRGEMISIEDISATKILSSNGNVFWKAAIHIPGHSELKSRQSVRYSGSKLHSKGVLLSIEGLPANQVCTV